MQFRAVIFDFDGTVVQSEGIHFRLFRKTLAKTGVKLTRKKYYTELIGTGTASIIAKSVADAGKECDINALAEQKLSAYRAYVFRNSLRTTPGLRTFLKRLKKKGIKTAIASSGNKETMSELLTRLNLDAWFCVLVGSQDVKNRKPDPEVFLKAAERLGVKPEECIVIEDAPLGIEAGRRAGMRVIQLESKLIPKVNGFESIKRFSDLKI